MPVEISLDPAGRPREILATAVISLEDYGRAVAIEVPDKAALLTGEEQALLQGFEYA